MFSLTRRLKDIWEVLTPQNEGAMRAANNTLAAANRTIQAGGNQNRGVLGNPAARQSFVASQAPTNFSIPRATFQSIIPAARKTGMTVGLTGTRVGTGYGQAASGLYDLITPGRGTNRFSKRLDRFAQDIDATAKAEGVDAPYKIGNVIGEAAAFVGGGAALRGLAALPQVAKIAKVVRPLNVGGRAIDKGVDALEKGSRAAKLAGTGLRAATRPTNVANMGIDATYTLGAEASKGRDISKGDVALATVPSVGLGVGLPVVARAVGMGGRATQQATKQAAQKTAQNAKRAVSLETPDVLAIRDTNLTLQKSFDNTPDVRQRQRINREIAKNNAEIRRLKERGSVPIGSPLLPIPGGRKVKVAKPIDTAAMGAEARQKAEEFAKSKISTKAKAQDFVSQNFTDDTNYWQSLDREIAKRKGTKVRKVSAADRLDPQIQAFRNATAMKEQRYVDTGISDFAKKLSNKQDYDNYTIYRTFRTNQERAGLNLKPGEDMSKAYARATGGRNYSQDAQAFRQLEADPKYNALFTEENEITKRILRDRGADPNLTMTPQQAEDIIAKYPNYTPQQRVMEDDLLQFERKGNIGSMQGKNVKEIKEGSFSRPLEDPLTALTGYSDELVAKSQGNKVISNIVENFPDKVRPLVTAEQLRAKEMARVSLGELGLAGRAVEKELKRNTKFARSLQRELDRLNKEGMNASLKKVKTVRELPKKTVTIKTVGPLIKDNAPKTLDDLSQSYLIKDALLKEYGSGANGIRQMAADVYNGGWTQLMDLNPNISESTAKSIAGQILKKPTVKAGFTKVSEGSTGRMPSPKQLIEDLMNKRPADIQRIVNKISARDAKLAPLMDDIQRLANQADDIKAAKVGIWSSGDLAKFESSANKNTKRRVVQDADGVGREEIYEIIDPRMAQNLDQLSGNELHKAAEVLGVPTRVFKFFTTGPGSPAFIPIALTRDLFASILTAKAPLRAAFDPRSYLDAFQAAVKRGDLFAEGQRRGISGTMTAAERSAEAIGSKALRNPGMRRVKTWANGKQLFRDIEDIGNFSERFTRMRLASGVYRQSLARYARDPSLTPEQIKDRALWDMAEEYREGAINFGRGGTVTKNLNAGGVVYLNPAVQGANRLRRVAKENPGRFIAGMATATSLIGGTIAYNRSSEERKKVWDNLSPEEKATNVILMGPNAKFNEETGEITGIIKLAAPYEFRPLLTGMNQVFDDANPADYGDMALAGLASLSGLDTKNPSSFLGQLIPQQLKPFIEHVTNHSFFRDDKLTPDYITNRSGGDKSEETKKNSSGIAKVVNRLSGNSISPIEADNYISGAFGGASRDIAATGDFVLNKLGAITDKETTKSDPLTRLKKRTLTSYGDSDAGKYFDAMENAGKGLRGQDQLLLKALMTSRYDENGKKVEKDPASMQVYYEGMFNDNVRHAYVKGQKDAAKAQGKDYDPLYDLPDSQLKQYFRIKATPRDSDDQRVLENRNPWLKDLNKKRSSFFDKLDKDSVFAEDDSTDDVIPSGVKYPKLDSNIQSKLDVLGGLDDATKAEYIRDNPDVQTALDSFSQYTNDVRKSLLQPELKPYPKASPEVQSWIDEYNSLPKGDGPRGGSPTRAAWIKANPNKYASMQTAFANSAAWTLANNAGLARFKGEELNQKALKSAYSLGNYSIAKGDDGTYSLNPQQASADKQAKYFARSGGRRGPRAKTIRIRKGRRISPKTVRIKKLSKPKTVKIKQKKRTMRKIKRT